MNTVPAFHHGGRSAEALLRSQISAKDELIQELEDRIEYLEAQLQDEDLIIPASWQLSPSEGKVLKCLLRRNLMTRDNAMALLYSARGGDEPGDRIIDVFVAKIRRKLKRHGITIATQWGQGWYLSEGSKEIVRKVCQVTDSEAAS